jgi:hypothetical protein
MGALDPRVAEALDELVPPRPAPDRWDDIVFASAPRRSRRWIAAAVPVAAVAGVAALALAWPFGGSGPQGTILERAAAAIGDGPVLHVVMREGWGGTLVDLDTGERRDLHAEKEIWHDAERGTHTIFRFDGTFVGDHVDPPDPRTSLDDYVGKTFAAIATGLRDGIRKGTVRVLEDGAVEGEPVHWVRVDAKMLPDVEDGKLHEWAHDVAVSQERAEVVATRETRDGTVSPGGIAVVLEAEALPAGAGDFTAEADTRREPTLVEMGRGRTGLTLAEATARLGRPALWAGPRVARLELATVWEDVLRQRTGRAGPWRDHGGVSLFYGVLDDAGNPVYGHHDFDGFVPEPYVRITETSRPPRFRVSAQAYVPPEGSVHLSGHGRGVLHRDGVHVMIEAPSDEVVLSVARALEPAPER